jgi:hypothetical protein
VFTNSVRETPTAAAVLTVVAPPAVTLNPDSKTVVAGETATFTSEAVGNPAPAVQWQISADGGRTWTADEADPGATATTLTVAATALGQSGDEYRAVFCNGVTPCAESTPATLTVVAPPQPVPPAASFTWFPANIHPGETVTLVSTSTDSSSPISGLAWDVLGNGPFAAGSGEQTTSFATVGPHVVRLRATAADGLSAEVAETLVVHAVPLALMQPFPIIRIAGSDGRFGAHLTVLSVLAPVGSTITVTCRGQGCPHRVSERVASSRHSHAGAVLVAFPRFERPLPAGAVLTLRVFEPGMIGKYTSFRIRRSQAPLRLDRCLDPATLLPMGCPT